MFTINSITNWFKVAKPEPTRENVIQQSAVHFEEFAEMCEAIGYNDLAEKVRIIKTNMVDECFSEATVNHWFKDVDRVELLDSLCDQIVTAIGVAYMMGFDINGALQEVDRSNWSKFVDGKPVINEHGKIIKGENYFKPNLVNYL